MKHNKLSAALWAPVCALFSLTAAVAVPILWRGWYACQVGPLGLEAYTGWSWGPFWAPTTPSWTFW